jgi:O-methyltransferase
MKLLPPSARLIHGLLTARRGTLAQKLNLLRCLRRNLKMVTSASGPLEQLFMMTRLLNLKVPGAVVECGSYKGGSAVNLSLACDLADRQLFICDSFAGLPKPSEGDRTHSTIDGMTDDYEEGWWLGTEEEVRSNIARYGCIRRCTFVRGWFEDALPKLTAPVAMVFCDVDLADSLKACLKYLWPLLNEGAILFTHEAMQREIFSIFYDDEWWRRNLGCAAPGLVGGGSGLGLYPTENGYYGSCLAYTVKSPPVVWARRIAGVEAAGATANGSNQQRPQLLPLTEVVTQPSESTANSMDRIKVLYIAGSHRCGSTLLARLLGSLPGFFPVGEALLHFFGGSSRNQAPCGCGRPVQECSFWTGVPRPVDTVPFGARWLRLRRVALLERYLRRHPELANELMSQVGNFYSAIAKRAGAEVIVDSSKSPFHAKLLSLAPNIDLYVVDLLRDPRSIVASSRRRKEWIPRTSPLRTTKRWILVTLGTEYLRTSVPRCRVIRYEDFVKAPGESILQIAGDLGYTRAAVPFVNQSVAELGPQHMLGSNPDKLTGGTTTILDKSLALSRSTKTLVTILTAPFLRRYGYWGEGRRGRIQMSPRAAASPEQPAAALADVANFNAKDLSA